MGADAGTEQLVAAQAQDVEHRRVELVQRTVAARGEHRVVGALAAQGAVGELGRQGGVAAGELAVGEQPGQQQVGVGRAVADRREYVVGGAARVGGPRAPGWLVPAAAAFFPVPPLARPWCAGRRRRGR